MSFNKEVVGRTKSILRTGTNIYVLTQGGEANTGRSDDRVKEVDQDQKDPKQQKLLNRSISNEKQ